MKSLLRKSKPRLYLALFACRYTASSLPQVRFTPALLLCPKNPKGTDEARLFQLTKSTGDSGMTQWTYERKATRPRTPTLVAVMLLGKPIISEAQLAEILAAVPIPEDCSVWTPAYWTCAAIDAMIAQDVIDTPSGADGIMIWDRACHFAEPLALDWDDVLPAVNIHGNIVESEIRRMEKFTLQ